MPIQNILYLLVLCTCCCVLYVPIDIIELGIVIQKLRKKYFEYGRRDICFLMNLYFAITKTLDIFNGLRF